MIPKWKFGKTGAEVSCIGLGSEEVLRTFGRERKAQAVITRPLELGVSPCLLRNRVVPGPQATRAAQGDLF